MLFLGQINTSFWRRSCAFVLLYVTCNWGLSRSGTEAVYKGLDYIKNINNNSHLINIIFLIKFSETISVVYILSNASGFVDFD